MFIVSLTYTCDIKQIEHHLAAHIEYLERQYAVGKFLASGRKNPRSGGVIFAVAGSLDELEAILVTDPFKINNLADYEITEFIPSKTAPELVALLGL